MKYVRLIKQLSLSIAVLAGLVASAPLVSNSMAVSADSTNAKSTQADATVKSGNYDAKNPGLGTFKFSYRLNSDGALTITNATVNGTSSSDSIRIADGLPSGIANQVKSITFSGDNNKAAGNLKGLFSGFTNLTSVDASNLDVTNAKSLKNLFYYDSNLTDVNLTGWQKGQLTDMSNMFAGTMIRDAVGLDKLNTSKVTDFSDIFQGGSTNPDARKLDYQFTQMVQNAIDSWDVSSGQNFISTLSNPRLYALDISKWNMGNSTKTTNLFGGDGDGNSWVTPTITLGPKTKLVDSDSIEPTYKSNNPDEPVSYVYYLNADTTVTLPKITPQNTQWQAVGNGTPVYPTGKVLSATAIQGHFSGTNKPTTPQTYVWAHETPTLDLKLKTKKVQLTNGQKSFDPATVFESVDNRAGSTELSKPITTYADAVKLGLTVSGVDKINFGVKGDYPVTYELGNDSDTKQTVTVTVPTTTNGSGNGGSSANNGSTTNSGSVVNGNSTPSTTTTPSATGSSTSSTGTTSHSGNPVIVPNYAAVKGAAVYAVKGIYMYRTPNFTKSQRIAKYPKAKRTNRPMFVVTNYARSNGGALRYKVRDVKTHKVGYITANSKYVVRVYYQTMPKNKKITVISKKGVNSYKHASLTSKVKHYKKGTRLAVKKLVKHGLSTRYQLMNGRYVTANKKLVIQGNY